MDLPPDRRQSIGDMLGYGLLGTAGGVSKAAGAYFVQKGAAGVGKGAAARIVSVGKTTIEAITGPAQGTAGVVARGGLR